MPLIEGIGDEVLQFFGLLLAGGLAVLAWWSTNITDIPRITVLVLGSRERPVQTVNNEGPTQSESVPEDDKENPNSKVIPGSVQGTQTESPNADTGAEEMPETAEATAEDVPSSQSAENIRIRLKYLNDEQKLVEGQLQELLGDFKRRNFRAEISRQQRIRLIFNGQVLQSDERTLQGCGLFDNCVVHCLVHNQSNPNPNGSQTHAHNSPPEWNMSYLLYVLLTIILAMAWFCRYQYSQLFNVLTTGTLIGLTIMFGGSVVGHYMPDPTY